MFIDARQIPADSEIEADLCVVGAGAAGIAIVRELAGSGLRICLLESGGFRREAATQALYEGENAGLPYESAERGRSRFFGGSTNCWGGWCRPLEPLDFARRDWVPDSGWPFGREALDPFYRRAHGLLQLGAYDYDASGWQADIGRPDAELLPLRADGDIVNKVLQFSPPTRFGEVYRAELAAAADVQVLLHANVTLLRADADCRSVRLAEVATLDGRRFRVAARSFVLATGGIENARLLLASNDVAPAGLGNAYDLVGRYFMDHPRLQSGLLAYAAPERHAALYDPRFNFHSRQLRAHGISIAAHLGPSAELQRRARTLNARTAVISVMYGEESPGFRRLKALYQEGRRHTHRVRPSLGDLACITADLPEVAVAGLAHVLKERRLVRLYRIEDVTEPVPNRDSRVTLSHERDALGMPRVRVDWRLTALERQSLDTIRAAMTRELAAAGLARITPEADDALWPNALMGCWHHMGTTRMHDDPRRGVVDADCRVHGMANLHVAGSSVFPTGGADTPTITIVALALRLADRLRRILRPGASGPRLPERPASQAA